MASKSLNLLVSSDLGRQIAIVDLDTGRVTNYIFSTPECHTPISYSMTKF